MNSMRFHNKVVLITGGSTGIGRATALAFAQEGAQLVIADINEEQGEAAVAEISALGQRAIFVPTDVSQKAHVKALITTAVSHFGRIDCALNNAGIEGELARTADISEADFDRIIGVNLKGVWLCLKYEIRQMLQQEGGGVIVNTASVAGLVGSHSMPVYGASKHGVVGLTKSAAVEYGAKGIRVNAICPAVIRTPMVERTFAKFPKFEEGIVRFNPLRRLGEADEVSAAILWLCSPAASFVNGAALPVDGGFTAQ